MVSKVGRVAAGTLNKLATDRVVGLAGEAAFFALLSLPPLALALAGTLGYFHNAIGADNIDEIQRSILRAARTVLSPSTVHDTVEPTVHDVLHAGRADVVSIGFVISLWSGSRAMSTYMDAITIAYGLQGKRSWLTKRVLAYGFYLATVVIGAVLVPLLIIGPRLTERGANKSIGHAAHAAVTIAYWPVVLLLSIASLATLYHLAVPVKKQWRRALPGAAFALVIWVAGSTVLRLYFAHASSTTSAYGALAAPVAVLIWLWLTALAIIIGAELNSEIDKVWPPTSHPRPDFLGATQRFVERTLRLGSGVPQEADPAEAPPTPTTTP